MPSQSTQPKPLSGFQRRKLRAAQGLPKYTPKEAAARKVNDLARGRARKKQQWATYGPQISGIKLSSGCVDCGYNAHPAALHFDHLPGVEKRRNLSKFAGAPWSEVLAEIAKCEVVCANCHAIRTAHRRIRT